MRPSRLLVKILGYWCLLALLISAARIWLPQLAEPLRELWWFVGALLIFAALLDWRTGKNCAGLSGSRKLPGNLALGVEHNVTVNLHNNSNRSMRLLLSDQLPLQSSARKLPLAVQLQPEQEVTLHYPLVPRTRGQAEFGQLELLVDSPWQLWQRKLTIGAPQTVKIYPDFLGISSLQSLSSEQTLRYLGVHQQQRRGEGMDFRQLREYRLGDSPRQVDWRASARMQKLISREYQDERDQEIIFLLDCGRRMRTRDGDLSHFDHALNALLLSAYVAIKQGDSVGLQCFAGSQKHLPPVKGESGINLLLNHVYELHSGTAHSDYTGAAQQLLARQSRRALVILLTNVRDEDSDELLGAVRLLSRQHLVMVASLRETALDELLQQPVANFNDAINFTAGQDFIQRRSRLLKQLRARNTILADSVPAQMHMTLVENYWQLKRSGQI